MSSVNAVDFVDKIGSEKIDFPRRVVEETFQSAQGET